MPSFSLILPAAGASVRYGRNKLAELLDGVPVVVRSLRAFLAHPDMREIVIPTGNAKALSDLLNAYDATDSRIQTCPGGETRADSVRAGVRAVSRDIEWCAIHDAARPLVTRELIDRTLAAAVAHSAAAVPALPVHLTIKQARGPLPARVQRTLPRHELWAMQTPQVARREELLDAFEKCRLPLGQITDDVQLIELLGKPVWLVEGEEANLKITTPMDLHVAETLLRAGI